MLLILLLKANIKFQTNTENKLKDKKLNQKLLFSMTLNTKLYRTIRLLCIFYPLTQTFHSILILRSGNKLKGEANSCKITIQYETRIVSYDCYEILSICIIGDKVTKLNFINNLSMYNYQPIFIVQGCFVISYFTYFITTNITLLLDLSKLLKSK